MAEHFEASAVSDLVTFVTRRIHCEGIYFESGVFGVFFKCSANQLSTWKNANDQKKTLPLLPQVFTSSNLSNEGLKSGPALTADSIQYQFGTA